MFKRVASYVFIDKEKEFQSRIECSISTISGDFFITLVEMEGFKFTQDVRYSFTTREEANAKFLEIKNSKGYPYTKETFKVPYIH